MSWNHRVTVEVIGGVENWAIREVYYDVAGPGNIGWTQDAVTPFGETEVELLNDINRFIAAFDQPPLYIDQPFPYKKPEGEDNV